MKVDHAVNALETFLTEDAKRGTISSEHREWLLERWEAIKAEVERLRFIEDRIPEDTLEEMNQWYVNDDMTLKVSPDDKMDLLEHLDLPVGNWFLPQDYDPERSSCYDFKAEVEEAYGVKASLAGIQGDHFCLIWLKPSAIDAEMSEDYTYPSGSQNKDEVCYYVQPAWDEPSEDNEWKGEWYLEIHPQEDE